MGPPQHLCPAWFFIDNMNASDKTKASPPISFGGLGLRLYLSRRSITESTLSRIIQPAESENIRISETTGKS